MSEKRKIGVIGVGKVGLPLACFFSELGHEVFICDKNKKITDKVSQGTNPYPWEEDLAPEVLKSLKICSTPNMMAIDAFDIQNIFIVTPTPEIEGYLSPLPVVEVLSQLEGAIGSKSKPVVSIVSTLDPRGIHEVCFRPFPVVYNPPLIRLGRVKRDLIEAKILFLGTSFASKGDVDSVASCYRHEHAQHKEVRHTTPTIACAKLAINASLSMRAAWANQVAETSALHGANIHGVFAALSIEERIGGVNCQLPGPPPGGPCLPRDVSTWHSLSKGSALIDSVKKAHEQTIKRVVQGAFSIVNSSKKVERPVLIVGAGYKTGGPDFTDSLGYLLAANVGNIASVKVYDPALQRLFAVTGNPLLKNIRFLSKEDARDYKGIFDFIFICNRHPELDCKELLSKDDQAQIHDLSVESAKSKIEEIQ